MTFLLIAAFCVFFAVVAPRAAAAAAWIVTVGFILPFFTFGGGTLLWATCSLFVGGPLSFYGWWLCCAAFGLPLGLLTSWLVLKD